MSTDNLKPEALTYMRGLRLARWLIVGMIYFSVLIIAVPVYLYTLPDIEAAYAPPIIDQRIVDPHLKPNDPAYYLWTWLYKKVRRGTPEYITFMAWSEEAPDVRYNVDTYIGWDCKNNMRSDRTAQPGPDIISRKMCIKLPAEIAGRNDIHVDGIMDFKLGHSLYTVPVRVPPNHDDWPSPARSIPVAP